MILSVSRRTDVPAFFSPWLMQRLREGYALVRNPMNGRQVSRVALNPETVDGIVFWTKNVSPLLAHLPEIGGQYPYYVQYTLNGYGRDVEPGLPPVEARLESFRRAAEAAGPLGVVWRYDPVLLSGAYTAAWHVETFARLAQALRGFTGECVFSFIDLYEKAKRNLQGTDVRGCTAEEMRRMAAAFGEIAGESGMRLRTCAETIDLSPFGVEHGSCIDRERLEALCGWRLSAAKAVGQRPACGCMESVDIGGYNTCRHGCLYCYANQSPRSAAACASLHDPASPLLTGALQPEDRVTERRMRSLKIEPLGQLSMF